MDEGYKPLNVVKGPCGNEINFIRVLRYISQVLLSHLQTGPMNSIYVPPKVQNEIQQPVA
jgi:hypothetical protein